MYTLYPIQEKEKERLGLTEFEKIADDEVIGIMLTPSRVREGIKRWISHGLPPVFTNEFLANSLQAVKESVESKHQRELAAEIKNREDAMNTLLSEFEEKYVE